MTKIPAAKISNIKIFALVLMISILTVACGPILKKTITKSKEKKPGWAKRHENWLEEDTRFIFIGRAEGADSELNARQNALSNALSHFSSYFGVTISSEFTEKTKEKGGKFSYEIDLFSKHEGTRVKLKKYNVLDFYFELTESETDAVSKKSYKSMIQVAVPKDEMARIEKKLKPGQAESEWIEKIKAAAAEMLKDKDKFSGKKVAVGNFSDNKKKVTELSFFIADLVEMVLISELAGSADVIGMKELKEDMKSWRLGVKGRVNEDNSTQAGKLLGVNAFCFGTYTVLGDSINLNMKVVETDTGKILAGTSLVLGTNDRILGLSKQYIETKVTKKKSSSDEKPDKPAAAKKSDPIKIYIWSEKEKYESGDKIKFFVKTDKDCYLSLIHVDALGKVTMLFPNYYAPSNFVKGGQIYSVPSEKAGFDFIASEPYGYEIVRGIATKYPQIDIKTAMADAPDKKLSENVLGRFDKRSNGNGNVFAKTEKINEENPFGLFVAEPSSVTRGISVKAKKAAKGDWAEAVIKIKITP